VLCWASWSTGALAAPPRTTADLLETEEDFTGDIDTVISATRIRQPLTESPASVTIIDRDMIAASGAIEVADTLRLVPGMQVSYPTGNLMSVTYHGLGDEFPRDMQILIDGRSVYKPSYADVDWLFLGLVLEDIERIEVIRGPNSPLYGSNAVSGVINIITRLPYQDRGTSARITAGSLATRDGVIRHGGQAGTLDYRVTLNYQEADGFDGDLNSTNDNRKLAAASFRGIWHPRPSDEVDIQLGYTQGDLGAGAEPQDDPIPHDRKITGSYESISWRRAQQDEADLRIQLYHNAYDSDDHYRDSISHAFSIDPEVVPFLLDGNPDQVVDFGLYDYAGERYDMEFQYTSPQSGRLRAVAGGGIRLDRLKSETLTNRNDWIDDFSQRAFINLSYRTTDQLLLNFGAMAENSDEFGPHLSPRLAVNWLFDKQHSVRASYTRAIRNPSLVEKHFYTVNKLDDGTPYLIDFAANDPGHEKLTSIELGYVGYWLDRRLMLDAKLFHEKTDDRIRRVDDPLIPQPFPSPPLPSVSSVINDHSAKVYGAEFQLKYQTGPRDFISLQASKLDTDIVQRRQTNPDVFKIWKETVAPRYTISALLSKSLPHGFEVSAAWYHMSPMVWLGDGDRIPGYDRVDARAAKRWRTAGSNMMLEAIVQNIGDDYLSFRDENFFETRAYLRFSLDFN
jgi:iron complex outermembrane receptor protein